MFLTDVLSAKIFVKRSIYKRPGWQAIVSEGFHNAKK